MILWFYIPRVTPGDTAVTKQPWFGSVTLSCAQAAQQSPTPPPAAHGLRRERERLGCTQGITAMARPQHPSDLQMQGKWTWGAIAEAGTRLSRQGCHHQVAMVLGGKREDAPEHRKRLSRFRFKTLWQHFGRATAQLLWQPASEKKSQRQICNYKRDGDLPTLVIRAFKWLEQRRGCSVPHNRQGCPAAGSPELDPSCGTWVSPVSHRLQLWGVTFGQDTVLRAGFEAGWGAATYVLQGGSGGSRLVLGEPEAWHKHSTA